ncbi:MAG: M56 family metallopeptidase [Steroidobacteraceae bacterium]
MLLFALLALWALGAAFVSARWLLRWQRVSAVCCAATALPIAAPIPVKASRSSLEPGLVGIRYPVILIPEALVGALAGPELDAIIAHELSHARRRDNLTGLVQMAAEALCWFYPPVWWLGSPLVAERERACDEAVLAAGNDAEAYAESILKVCKFHVRSPLICAAGVSGTDLNARIEAIMHGCHTIRLTVARKWLLTAAGAAALALPTLAGMLVIPTASAAPRASATADASSAPQSTASAQAQIAKRRYEQARPRTAVAYNPADFDKYAGYYELAPGQYVHLWRNADRYLTQLTAQGPVEIFPDSQSEFFAKVVPAQITFETNSSGHVMGLVLHQGGLLIPGRKVSASVAKSGAAALDRRIKAGIASPGTEKALRRFIESMERGHPDYDDLSDNLATAVRAQEPITTPMFKKAGSLVSLKFKGVGVAGADIYDAAFAHGKLEFRISPLDSAGKIQGLNMRPLP